MNFRRGLVFGFLISFPLAGHAMPQQIVLESSIGENYMIEIQPDHSFYEVMDLIQQSVTAVEAEATESCCVDYSKVLATAAPAGFRMSVANGGISVQPQMKKANSIVRDYNAGMRQSDKDDISYIVKTLANSNLLKIKKEESSLKRAGDRVATVHPLHFVGYIFGDEELKVCMRNLQGRSWVWKSFLDGIKGSLADELANNNVMNFVPDFAKRLAINPKDVAPAIQAGQAEKLVDILIKIVPRKGDTDRYDM